MPWRKPEKRSYTSSILSAVFQHATTVSADAGKIGGVEAGAGFVARALAGARIEGPEWAKAMLTPMVFSQIGRSLIRRGGSVWAVEPDMLTEASYWNFEEGANSNRSGWRCRVTDNGPHGSRVRVLPYDRILFLAWGHDPALPWAPSGPLQFASTTAALASNAERALSHEAATPVSSVVEIPAEGWSDDELASVKSKITAAEGRLFFSDTLKTGDKNIDPDSPWRQRHIGPMMMKELNEAARDGFQRALASMGLPPDLFQHGANSQGQKEAARRAHLNVILPLGEMIEHELRVKLDGGIRLKFETYFADLVGRSMVVEKLVNSGVAINVALSAVGLDDD
ncbi:MAG: hypothetical protein OXF66_07595 [Gammaproteobacteria bacterium]|nr:hypothetical protein [Gammaproteobacteria bacterium]